MKILISPGWGAGWSTWNSGDIAKFMLTYQPIIDYLENGGEASELVSNRYLTTDKYPELREHPLLTQLYEDAKAKFAPSDDDFYICTLGADDLVVADVYGQFQVSEYDGNESVVLAEKFHWYSEDDFE